MSSIGCLVITGIKTCCQDLVAGSALQVLYIDGRWKENIGYVTMYSVRNSHLRLEIPNAVVDIGHNSGLND